MKDVVTANCNCGKKFTKQVDPGKRMVECPECKDLVLGKIKSDEQVAFERRHLPSGTGNSRAKQIVIPKKVQRMMDND